MTAKPPRVAWYMRVSTKDQTLENQRLELNRLAAAEGWTDVQVFADVVSGAAETSNRPQYAAMVDAAARRRFDIVGAWSIDRLGRRAVDLLSLADLAKQKRFALFFQKERVDTSTPSGELLFGILASFAQMERARISERVTAGLSRARAQGKQLGHPGIGNTERDKKAGRSIEKITQEIHTRQAQGHGQKRIARDMGIGIHTVRRLLGLEGDHASQAG